MSTDCVNDPRQLLRSYVSFFPVISDSPKQGRGGNLKCLQVRKYLQ